MNIESIINADIVVGGSIHDKHEKTAKQTKAEKAEKADKPIKFIKPAKLSKSLTSDNTLHTTECDTTIQMPGQNLSTSAPTKIIEILPTTITTTTHTTHTTPTTPTIISNDTTVQLSQQTSDLPPVNIVIKACKNITSKQALLMIPITKFFSNRIQLNKLIEILKGESISLRLIDWFVTNYCKKYNVIYNLSEYRNKKVQVPVTKQIEIVITDDTSPKVEQPKPSFDNFIIVHNNYKGQLKAYSKRNFDPFCRRNRIRFYYEDNKYFITTVGQLNFFKWALENFIVNYIDVHVKAIDDDMNNRCETVTTKKQGTKINPASVDAANPCPAQQQQADTTKKKKNVDGIITVETNIKTKKNGSTRKKRKEISSSASKSLSIHNYPTTLVFD
jgi:hypothetical protein